VVSAREETCDKLSLGVTSLDSYLVIVRDRYERQAHELGSSGVIVGHDRFRKNGQPTSRPSRYFGCPDSSVIQIVGYPNYSVIHIVRSST
jgi:hypothetical protein